MAATSLARVANPLARLPGILSHCAHCKPCHDFLILPFKQSLNAVPCIVGKALLLLDGPPPAEECDVEQTRRRVL